MSADCIARIVALIVEESPEVLANINFPELSDRVSDFGAQLKALARQRETEARGD